MARLSSLLLLLLVACGGGTGPTSISPTFDRSDSMLVRVEWVEDISTVCLSDGATACASPDDDGLCTIYMPADERETYSFDMFYLLGHEFSHCVWGYWHGM